MKTQKRLISWILTIAMVVCMIPMFGVQVYAKSYGYQYQGNDINDGLPIENGQDYYGTYTTGSGTMFLSNGFDLMDELTFASSCAITLESNVTIPGIRMDGSDVSVTIDLNGYTLFLDEEKILLDDCATLNIYDNNPSSVHYFEYATNAAWTYLFETPADYISFDEITDETESGTAIEVKGGCITGSKNKKGAIEIINDSTVNMYGGNIIGNSARNGGAIFNGSLDSFHMNGGSLIGNYAEENGGAICSSDGFTEIDGGVIRYNVAEEKGGGIYNSEASELTIYSGIISNNIAGIAGGGVYDESSVNVKLGACFIEGTKITMADGSLKNIEDVENGEMIKTFDHEIGEVSSEAACFKYVGENKSTAMILHFEDEIELGIVGSHALLEKTSRKYINLSSENAEDYIDKYFYNADDDVWEKLVSVSYTTEVYNYYALCSEHHINSIANHMISATDDTSFRLNTFDLDEDLKIDQIKKQEDIEEYGLSTYETYYEISGETEESFYRINNQYNKVSVGKGLITLEELITLSESYSEVENNPPMLMIGGPLLTGTFGQVIPDGEVTIINNTANGKPSNLYLTNGKELAIEELAETSVIGLTTQTKPTSDAAVRFTTTPSITASDAACFFSDNRNYIVNYVAEEVSYAELICSDAFNWYYNNTTGNNGDSFVISNVAELEALAEIVNSGIDDFNSDDIKLSDDFCDTTPFESVIGIGGEFFAGAFDGNGKEIRLNTFVEDNAYGANVGLFGNVSSSGMIINVGVSGTAKGISEGPSCIGGIAALNYGQIINCYSTATLDIKTQDDDICAGGIVGCNFGTIENCYATGIVTGSSKNAGATVCIGGLVGNSQSGSINSCYYLGSIATTVAGINAGTINNCYALSASQMKGIAKASPEANDTSWVTLDNGIVSMVDELTRIASYSYDLRRWGIMTQGNYPTFADNSVIIYDHEAYISTDYNNAENKTIFPAGLSYDSSKNTYIFENVNFGGTISFDELGNTENTKIELKGINRIGVLADTTKFVDQSNIYYAQGGIVSLTTGGDPGQLGFVFTGNGSLTIYDSNQGISAENITFDENFTGTITINDYGASMPAPVCCMAADQAITIKNGTFILNNTSTSGISATNVNISGGNISVKGGVSAISAETLNISNTLEITGANETYDYANSSPSALTNKDSGYVVIKAKSTEPNVIHYYESPTVTVPVSGDKTSVKVQATVNGANATVKNISKEEIVKVGTADEVVMDLSGLSKSVTGVTIPKSTLENVAASDAKGLEVKMPNGTIAVFDKEVLSAIASQATGNEIKLVIDRDSKAESSMSSAQKDAIKEMNDPVVIDAYFTSNGSRISDFKGGEADITAEYKTSTPVRVWYLTDAGEASRVPSTFDGTTATFTVNHFSHYVIEKVDADAYKTCPKDETCVYAKFIDSNTNGWYHNGVHFCTEWGYIDGEDETHFNPNGILTRGMMVRLLYNYEGRPEVKKASTFTDVETGRWFTDAIAWAQANNVVEGIGDNLFDVDGNLTREQLATLFYKFAKYKGYDTSKTTTLDNFSDAGKVRKYAQDAFKWAVANGIIEGSNGKLNPKGLATRAEAAVLLQQFIETFVK